MSTTSWEVCSPGITSIIGIRCGGFDQCMPTTRSGCAQTVAIFVIGIPDVFEASTASSATCFSNSTNTSCFSSIFSGTASSTKSAPSSAAARSVSKRSEPPSSDAASSRSSTPSAIVTPPLARSSASSETSWSAVSMPARASTAPMPGPIVPVPITAARRTSAMCLPPSAPGFAATRAQASAAALSWARRHRPRLSRPRR